MLKQIKQSILVLYLALRDQRTPWYVKLLLLLTVAYLLSPVDLIPDFIPVIGYLDDILLVPIMIRACLALIAPALRLEYAQQAEQTELPAGGIKYIGLLLVILIWVVVVYLLVSIFFMHNGSG